MATVKCFWQDPYLTELTTCVTSVHGTSVTLAETIFYAFSGGQESDAGAIGGYSVLEARKQGLEIMYALPEGHLLSKGQWVQVRIDWARRYRLMRLHFAAEIVLVLVSQSFPTIRKVGAHIGPDKARIDFEWEDNLAAALPALQLQAQALIDANLPIFSRFSNPLEETRYWEIPGFAAVPCGGTHPRSTAEVGVIQLKRNNPGRGKERVEIRVADEI